MIIVFARFLRFIPSVSTEQGGEAIIIILYNNNNIIMAELESGEIAEAIGEAGIAEAAEAES